MIIDSEGARQCGVCQQWIAPNRWIIGKKGKHTPEYVYLCSEECMHHWSDTQLLEQVVQRAGPQQYCPVCNRPMMWIDPIGQWSCEEHDRGEGS